MKYFLTAYCLLLTACFSKAADNDSTEIRNNILFFKDARVDVLQKIYSRKPAGPKKMIIRVQVFQAEARDKIFEAKAQFSARYPGIQTFVTYVSPNFKLRAGEFESKQEAFKFMQQIKPYFPTSFVIEEKGPDDKEKLKAKKDN
ncbi:MAG TPA: hypothetical protein PLS10_02565 [Chitinophagales bacterium]|nr:hypothetical protein [Chitinophagales bacterium]